MKNTPILILLILFLNGCKQRMYEVPVKAEVNTITPSEPPVSGTLSVENCIDYELVKPWLLRTLGV
jgi:hypothetical protein